MDNWSHDNIPAYNTLYALVVSSQEGSCAQAVVGCKFGSYPLADETVKKTEAMVNSREGNLSKHRFKAQHTFQLQDLSM